MSATSRNLIWNSVLYVAYQYAFWRRTRVWCEKQVHPYYSKLATLIVYYKSCHLVQMRPFRFGSRLLYNIYFFAIRPLTIIKKTLSIYFSASNTTTTEHSNNGDKKFLASTISQQPTSTEINTTAATTTNTSVPTRNKQSRKFRENVMLKTALENAATTTITPEDNKDEDAD